MQPDEHEIPELDVDGHSPEDIEQATRDALRAIEGSDPVAPSVALPVADLKADLARAEAEANQLRDRNMRLLADFENFRKRSDREREELKRYALAEPLRDFLAVVDNLDRALSAEGRAEDLKAGVEMIARQTRDLLRRHNVKEVVAEAQAFDPAVHEAVMRVEDDGVTEPRVIAVFQRGYTLHDRLLRPAMVKVAVPPASRPAEARSEDDGGVPEVEGRDVR